MGLPVLLIHSELKAMTFLAVRDVRVVHGHVAAASRLSPVFFQKRSKWCIPAYGRDVPLADSRTATKSCSISSSVRADSAAGSSRADALAVLRL